MNRAATGSKNRYQRPRFEVSFGAKDKHEGAMGYTDDEVEFMMAVQKYKEEQHRPHPTWAEVLKVARALGYRKVQE